MDMTGSTKKSAKLNLQKKKKKQITVKSLLFVRDSKDAFASFNTGKYNCETANVLGNH